MDENDIKIEPVLKVVPYSKWIAPSSDKTLIFSSSNAVRCAAENLEPTYYRAFCIGQYTTQCAQSFGFDASYAGQSVQDFLIHFAPKEKSFVHLRGEHTTTDLRVHLQGIGCEAESIIVYDQVELKWPNKTVEYLVGGTPVVLPLFSSRSAEIVCNQGMNWGKHIAIAISPVVAKVCDEAGFGKTVIAEVPNAEEMLKLTAGEYGKLSP